MKKILIVIVSMVMLLCLGLIYGWSIFVAPLEAEFAWSRGETSLTFTISMVFFCLAGLVAGRLNAKSIKPVYQLVFAGILLLIGFVMASFSSQLVHFYLTYGILCGAGVGLAYNVLISTVTRIFPEKQGFISGLLMMSFGFGGLVLGSICSTLIVNAGWREMFKVIGVLIGVIVICASLVLEACNKGLQKGAQTATPGDAQQKPVKKSLAYVENVATKDMLKEGTFRLVYIWLVVLSSSGLLIIGHIGPMARELGANTSMVVWAVGMVSIFNGLGRVVLGISYDKIGAKKTIWAISSLLLLAAILLSVSVNLGSLTWLIVGSAVMGFCYGGSPTSTAALVGQLYGIRYFPGNFSIAATHLIFAALIGPNLASFLMSGFGSYNTTLYALVVIAIITLVFCKQLVNHIKI